MSGRQNQLDAENLANQQNQTNFNNLFNGSPGQFTMNGTNAENAGRIEGLQRANVLTGQNPFEVGADYQDAYGNIKKRSNMSDTGSELLRANKAGSVADARNNLQANNVKGGSAMGAVSQIDRSKSYDVNNQLMQAQQKAQQDYMNAAKSNANFTTASEMNYGAMAAGKDIKPPQQFSNGFGTVICTELYRQGYYSEEVFSLDQAYGNLVRIYRPNIYIGYLFWANPLVNLMKKSEKFTKCVAFFAVPWAQNMAYKNNKFGAIISHIGEPICGVIGIIVTKFSGVKYVSN